jgi:hypothetical protein
VYLFTASLWRYPGMAGWHFITVPPRESSDIKKNYGKGRVGWGSIPVIVSVGRSKWKTSIFPDKKIGGYILPIKAEVRKKELIAAGDHIKLTIEINL